MKKFLLGSCFALAGTFIQAQNGLEQVIVEKYYVSRVEDATAADADLSGSGYTTGTLPAGSVTYRVYADMLSGYKFQALYAEYDVNTFKEHPMVFRTTTKFYNNSGGGVSPSWTKNNCKNNVLALDSWVSVGGACNGQFGVLKTDDNGMSNNVTTTGNTDSVLLNNNIAAGIPLITQDGLMAGSPQAVTLVGITNELDAFGDGSIVGDSVVNKVGSIASLNGSTGPTADNKVLIAQITTDGALSFELNIQVGTPTGGTENYVAKNPVMGEISMPSLIYPQTVGFAAANTFMPSFKVFPNPAKDLIALQFSGKYNGVNSYAIYSIEGQVIMQKNLGQIAERQVENIDVSSLANGLYIVEFTSDGLSTHKKIIKN